MLVTKYGVPSDACVALITKFIPVTKQAAINNNYVDQSLDDIGLIGETCSQTTNSVHLVFD
jgi:hypothetical protein